MENTHIACLALISVLVVIFVYWWCRRQNENFDTSFHAAESSTNFLQSFDMGDHRTMVALQRGNSGETVLFLHNNPFDMTIWQPVFATMQRISMTGVKTPNLIAYDLRGHGTAWMSVDKKFNDNNDNNYAWPLELFVEDCKKIYDNVIGGGKIRLCGFGFGGAVAQKYALTYPETLDKLVILQTSIQKTPGLREEITYLAGPNGWIAKNPSVTYLTFEEIFVQKVLCAWFYLPKDSGCPVGNLIDDDDDRNDQKVSQYNLTAALMRQGSATTALQIDKLLATTDFVKYWEDAKDIPFSIHILAATDDPHAQPDMMANTYATIYNNNRHVLVVFDVVDGRHGFTIMRPDYIAGIVCDACQTTYSKTLQN